MFSLQKCIYKLLNFEVMALFIDYCREQFKIQPMNYPL